MSIFYRLEVETSLSRKAVMDLLQEQLNASPVSDSLVTEGLEFEVVDQVEPPLQRQLEIFGLRPSLAIMFTIDKFGDRELAYTMMVRGLISVLESHPGGALFLQNGEQPYLFRNHHDEIWLHRNEFWKEERSSLLPWSYQWKDLPLL